MSGVESSYGGAVIYAHRWGWSYGPEGVNRYIKKGKCPHGAVTTYVCSIAICR